jgi:outer membrane lipoprotein SlyB
MENPHTPNRIHPLVAVAAIAVLIACLVGIAAMTGMLPNSNADKKSVAELQAEADQKAADAKAAADKVKQEREADRIAANKKARENERAHQAAAVCTNCGRVISVRAVQIHGKPSGVGVVGGAIVGGLLGNQIGGGTGKTLATVAGAVGGGYAGNEIEKRTSTQNAYEVNVQMEGGNVRSFPYNGVPPWHEGDRVRVVDGYLKAR